MQRETILLSVRPKFARQIFEGNKTTELRRVRPDVVAGQRVLIYSSSPTRALLGTAVVHRIEAAAPGKLWDRVRDTAGISRTEYRSYFEGADVAVAISLRDVRAFKRPLTLSELRAKWPWFRPPQSYCFVQASIHRTQARLTSLRPREVAASTLRIEREPKVRPTRAWI